MDVADNMSFVAQDQVNMDQIKYVTYGRIVVDYWAQKQDPHRTRLTVGGHFIFYPGDVGTPTLYITTANIIINSTVSTPG